MTSEERIEFGSRLRALREQSGLSLGKLAETSGVTKGYLSQLENGHAVNPSLEAVRKIAVGLGISMSDLLGEVKSDAARDRPLPDGLREFLESADEAGSPVTDDDVEMLLAVRYRGRKPTTRADFSLLYEFIKRLVR